MRQFQSLYDMVITWSASVSVQVYVLRLQWKIALTPSEFKTCVSPDKWGLEVGSFIFENVTHVDCDRSTWSFKAGGTVCQWCLQTVPDRVFPLLRMWAVWLRYLHVPFPCACCVNTSRPESRVLPKFLSLTITRPSLNMNCSLACS